MKTHLKETVDFVNSMQFDVRIYPLLYRFSRVFIVSKTNSEFHTILFSTWSNINLMNNDHVWFALNSINLYLDKRFPFLHVYTLWSSYLLKDYVPTCAVKLMHTHTQNLLNKRIILQPIKFSSFLLVLSHEKVWFFTGNSFFIKKNYRILCSTLCFSCVISFSSTVNSFQVTKKCVGCYKEENSSWKSHNFEHWCLPVISFHTRTHSFYRRHFDKSIFLYFFRSFFCCFYHI